MKFETFTATIAEHWVCPIEYADHSGLDDDEIADLDSWLCEWPSACFEYGEDTFFDKDEISGLMAICVTVKIHVPVRGD